MLLDAAAQVDSGINAIHLVLGLAALLGLLTAGKAMGG